MLRAYEVCWPGRGCWLERAEPTHPRGSARVCVGKGASGQQGGVGSAGGGEVQAGERERLDEVELALLLFHATGADLDDD